MTAAEFHVLVVMPQDLLRDGVCEAIASSDAIVVQAAAQASQGIEAARRQQPDVVLLALELQGHRAGFGLDLCRAIVAASPRSKVLCLADEPTTQVVDLALRAGARGVFDLDLSLELLGNALRTVKAGKAWTPVSSNGRDARLRTAGTSPLTAREHSVLALLAQGQDHNAIACDLFISPHTARTHIRNVMRKLGAHNRLEAVYLATDAGLLDQPAS
jgi:DNA-binding NarL/FixJ family response regulator